MIIDYTAVFNGFGKKNIILNGLKIIIKSWKWFKQLPYRKQLHNSEQWFLHHCDVATTLSEATSQW